MVHGPGQHVETLTEFFELAGARCFGRPPGFIQQGIGNQTGRRQRCSQFVRHDADGGQRVIQSFASQVGARESEHESCEPCKCEDNQMGCRLEADHRVHERSHRRSQHEARQGAQGGNAPVCEVKVDQHHGGQAGDPDRIAVVHHVHPAEKQGKLDEADGVEQVLRSGVRRFGREPIQHQQPARSTDAQSNPEVFVRLRQPDMPDPEEERMTDQREGPQALQAEDRGVKNGFQRRVQHLLPQLADGGMVREPVLERHAVHGHLCTSRAC